MAHRSGTGLEVALSSRFFKSDKSETVGTP